MSTGRAFTGTEINILCHMLYVFNCNELAKKSLIFFRVPVVAKLASTNLEAFTVRACSSAFQTTVPKFIRLSTAARTCVQLGFSKISKRMFENYQSVVDHLIMAKLEDFQKLIDVMSVLLVLFCA